MRAPTLKSIIRKLMCRVNNLLVDSSRVLDKCLAVILKNVVFWAIYASSICEKS